MAKGLAARLRGSALWPFVYTAYGALQMVLNAPRTPAYWRALRAPAARRRPASDEIVMLVVSDVRCDPRVEREARVLAAAGFSVTIIWPDAYPPAFADKPVDWGPRIRFLPAPARARGYVFGFPWLWGGAMHGLALRRRPLAFHGHDLNTALAALSAARKSDAFFVADFHEWFSENVHWSPWRKAWLPHSPIRRGLFRAIEGLVLRQADEVITVCGSIARGLEQEFPGRTTAVRVVRNIPSFASVPTRTYRPLREELGLPTDRFIVLWQGGVGPTRLIEPIIEALASAPTAVLVVRGPGVDRFGADYVALATRLGVADRLVLAPPVPSRDVVAAARGADAGVWTLPNLCKNFYYALPNKIFEYLAADLPLLAANFPEARRIAEEYEVGFCFDPYDPASIAAKINRMAADPALVSRLRTNVPRALADMRADREWEQVAELYQALAASAGLSIAPPDADESVGAPAAPGR